MAARKTKARRRARPEPTTGDMIDQLYEMREKRMELAASLREASKEEKALAEKIIGKLNEAKLEGAKGGIASFGKLHKRRVKPRANRSGEPDWKSTFKWVAKHDAWDMLYKRLIDSAVLDRMDDGIKVPVVVEPYIDYSLTKIG